MPNDKCRSCKAEIRWLRTSNGKSIPVDAATVQETLLEDQNPVFNPKAGHVSHFATCPFAKDHRKPRK